MRMKVELEVILVAPHASHRRPFREGLRKIFANVWAPSDPPSSDLSPWTLYALSHVFHVGGFKLSFFSEAAT